MRITKTAVAGTLESSDAMVSIFPSLGLEIQVNSSVEKQFGDDIRKTVREVLNALGVTEGIIQIEDKGALDCVLRARLKAALLRASDDAVAWEDLL